MFNTLKGALFIIQYAQWQECSLRQDAKEIRVLRTRIEIVRGLQQNAVYDQQDPKQCKALWARNYVGIANGR